MDSEETSLEVRIIFVILIFIIPYNLSFLLPIMTGHGYNIQYDFKTWFYIFLSGLMFFASSIPLFIYLYYGKEPKIDYNNDYVTDLPTDDPPAIVNALCGGGYPKKVGIPDLDGFKATIMDLIDRNCLILNTVPNPEDDVDSIFLEVNQDIDTTSLWEFELDVINFLQEYEQEGIISMEMISESLSHQNGAEFFKQTYENWVKKVKKTLSDEGSLNEAFLREGDKLIKIFGIMGLILAIIGQILIFADETAAFCLVGISSMILGFLAVISLLLPEKIAGKWTNYGKEYYIQWQMFKKYIEDFSLIKDYSPESVKVWNRYLVYATALGVADGVRRSMELSLPESILTKSDMYMLQYQSTPLLLLINGIKTALEPD